MLAFPSSGTVSLLLPKRTRWIEYTLPLHQTVTEKYTVVILMTQNRATFSSLSELLCAPTYQNILHKRSLGLVSCLFFLRSKWHIQLPPAWRKATCTTLKVEDKIIFASSCQSGALLLTQIWFERGLREKQALPHVNFFLKIASTLTLFLEAHFLNQVSFFCDFLGLPGFSRC